MTARDADTIALADRIERGLLYLMGDGPLLESEHCLIVAALRANRAAAVPSEEDIVTSQMNANDTTINPDLPRLLRAMATGLDAIRQRHDIILTAAADEIERLRANRAVADLEAENQELRVLLADERAAHRVCVEMRDEAERKSPDSGHAAVISKLTGALKLGREAVVESFEYAETLDDKMLAEARLRDIDDALGQVK